MKKMAEQKDMECNSHDNISLKLSTYGDIFSDFDPRQYSDRALSVDFLDEARRASVDKPSGDLELRLLLPRRLRDVKDEKVIRNRLKTHFEKHAKKMKIHYSRVIRNGLLSTIAGIAIMFFASLFLFTYTNGNFFMHFLLILFEPAGWFFFWEGLDQVVFESKKTKPDLDFYEKMAKSDIIFLSC
jgi:hypothetical protein